MNRCMGLSLSLLINDYFQFEKQATKTKSEELRNKLDDDWKDVYPILRPSIRTHQGNH